jgi:hypothetical protein
VTLPERWPRPRRSSSHAADRKRIEMLFAHVKRILRLGRLRLRGPCGAPFEFTLAAIAQNLRRLVKLVARLRRSCQPAPLRECCKEHRVLVECVITDRRASPPPLRPEQAGIGEHGTSFRNGFADPRPPHRRLLQRNQPIGSAPERRGSLATETMPSRLRIYSPRQRLPGSLCLRSSSIWLAIS